MADFEKLESLGIPRSLVTEILSDGVLDIFLRTDLKSEGLYFAYTIFLRPLGVFEVEAAARILSSKLGFELLPEEVFRFLIMHEYGHHKGLKEKEADEFAAARIKNQRAIADF